MSRPWFGARWRKLWADVRLERGRVALMVGAVALSLTALGAVLGTYAVLAREMARNLGTRPAEATLGCPRASIPRCWPRCAPIRASPRPRRARVVLARVRVGFDFRPLLLFVVVDFDDLRLNTFRREHGAWPPPRGTVLLERSALGMAALPEAAGTPEGAELWVKTPHGSLRPVRVSGIVHDPGLAPAWQERAVYAYATAESRANPRRRARAARAARGVPRRPRHDGRGRGARPRPRPRPGGARARRARAARAAAAPAPAPAADDQRCWRCCRPSRPWRSS